MFPRWPSTKIVQDVMICQKNVTAMGRGLFPLYIYIENFRNLLIRNHWTNFNITWQECFFGDPLLRLFKPSWFVKKHGRQGAGIIFPIYLVYKKLWKSSCQNPLDRIQFNTAEMFLWWPSTKIVQGIMIRQKHGRQGVGDGEGAFFSLCQILK